MGSQLTKVIGNFQTTLAANISAGGTTGTLSSANDKEGNALPAGKYCMIVNQGQSNEQHMIFDLSGVNMTNIVGVDHSGDVSVGALKDARINNPIKLTDFVNLLRIVEILNGISTLDGTSPMQYDAEPTITDRKQVIHAGYAQDLITGIMGTASDIAAGSTKMTKDQGSKPRAHSTYVREQNTPDMTLKVEAFRGAFIDSIINFAGGNSPAFINPGMGGDITIPTANPANGETVTLTINGTACVFTFVSSIGSTPGNVLIGGTQTITRANLAALINAPGTTNANQVAFTGAQLTAMGLVNCTDDLSSNIFVRATSATVTTFTMAETMAGSGNVVAVNTTKNRIDLLVLNGGSLAIRKGTEAVSPTIPTPTTGDTVLVSVYNIPGETVIRDRSAALSGYISDWYDFAVYRTDLLTKTGDGSTLTNLQNNPALANILPKNKITTCFETAARFTSTITGGGGQTSITYNATGAKFHHGYTYTASCLGLTWELTGKPSILYAGSPFFSTRITMTTVSISAFGLYFGLGNPTVAVAGHTFTVGHAGFKIIKSGGVISLYATQADGTTENASSVLTTLALGDDVELLMKINGSSSVDYYYRVNGGALSSATNLTANMPSGVSQSAQFSFSSHNTDDNSFEITVKGADYER